MRVAVFGARGQLGAAVVHEFSTAASPCEVVAFDRARLDVTDPERVASELDRVRPDAIINCAAYNAVDLAEDRPIDALAVNAFAVRTLARAATRLDAVLVHYGSDFVFDGTAARPYVEGDSPNPRSVYGTSKLLGEWFGADTPRHYVLRVESLFGSAPGASLARGSMAAIVQALRSGAAARVFEDRTVSPTYVPDAARATRELVERDAPFGLYHCVNSGYATWADVAREAARLIGVEPRLELTRLADAKLRAPRPLFCAMSNEKMTSTGIAMPTWQDALQRYLR
jgi:dTDP-4-dehydrorhamnose reductase